MDRRQFIKAGAAGLALSAAAGHTDEFTDMKKRYGLIGTGWYGKSAMFRLLQVAPINVVALCDVDQQMLSEAAEMVAERQVFKQKPRTYSDYREMLKQEDLEIVHVSTPDHWHCLPMIAAVQSGADVYVEKPISVDVIEGKSMLTAARKYNRVVQVGMQRRSTPHIIEALDTIINEGKLGRIGEVEICCYYHMRARGNPPVTEPPDYFDYETWTGPAPKRPYVPLVHPRRWRSFMEYSNGIVGDMCIHMFDMVRWMLGLGWPKQISSSGGIYVDKDSIANISDTQLAMFEYDDLNIVWQHRTYGSTPDPDYPWAATFYGDKGTLKVSVMGYDFIPRGKGKKIHKDVEYELEKYPIDKTEKGLEKHVAPALRKHMRNFLSCINDRSRPVSDIEQGYISSTSCILANLAMKTGRTLVWDPEKNRIKGDDEANQLLSRPYREPWTHPKPENV